MRPRYYVTRQREGGRCWGYWAPCLVRGGKPTRMALMGFGLVDCGEDGPAAHAKAQACNAQWDAARCNERAQLCTEGHKYAPGSLGEAFGRFRGTWTWREKKPRTREDWERAWKLIAPAFGAMAPADVSLEELDAWYAGLLDRVGVREAHRAMKIWRALWRVAAALKTAAGARYCLRAEDPSLGIRRRTPAPRKAIWFEGEAVRLVKRAWRMRYYGLAGLLAVAWDTMLSPVDVRGLTGAQLLAGSHFAVDRAKTGKAAIGTLSARARALLAALPGKPVPMFPLFLTRTGQPYRDYTMGADFRAVRAAEFPGDRRQIMDFRRSGAVEATAGDVTGSALAGKMANSIDANRALQETYQPHTVQVVRIADAARARGRGKLRGERS